MKHEIKRAIACEVSLRALARKLSESPATISRASRGAVSARISRRLMRKLRERGYVNPRFRFACDLDVETAEEAQRIRDRFDAFCYRWGVSRTQMIKLLAEGDARLASLYIRDVDL